jgi:HAD superfamily hydrolase (TIGR01509 family)
MKSGGVIFDFNGTLYWDSEYHELTWDIYLASHNVYISDEHKRKFVHGRNAREIFESVLKRKLTDAEVSRYTEDKELLYRNECLRHEMSLAPGAVRLFGELKERQVPMAIATAAGKSNMEFYLEKFNLLDYFRPEHIICNDGTLKSKPDPEIFDRAIQRLGVDKSRSIIFEDSRAGIQAAINCKVAHVIIVNSTNDDYSDFHLPVISHFDDFDRKLLQFS